MPKKERQKTQEKNSSGDEILALNITQSFDPKKNNINIAMQEAWVISPVRAGKVKYIIGFVQYPNEEKRRIVGIAKSISDWKKEDPELSLELNRKRQRYTFTPLNIENEYPHIIGLEFDKDRCSNPVRYFKESDIIKN